MQSAFNVRKLILSSCASALIAAVSIGLGGCSSDSSSDTPTDAASDSTSTDAASDSAPTEDASVDTSADVPVADSSDTDSPPTDADPSREPLFAIFHSNSYPNWFASVGNSNDYSVSMLDVGQWIAVGGGRVYLLFSDCNLWEANPADISRSNCIVSDSAGPVTATDTIVAVSDSKAYGVFQERPELLVFDPRRCARTGGINIYESVTGDFMPRAAVFDHDSKRIYVILAHAAGRSPSQLLAIDTQTDTIIDLNGDKSGKTLPLLGRDPQAVFFDASGNRILVNQMALHPEDPSGLEQVNLTAKTSSWLVKYRPAAEEDVWTRLVRISDTHGAVAVRNYTTLTQRWYRVDLANGTMDAQALDAPFAFIVESNGNLFGVSPTDDQYTHWNAVRYNVATKTTTILKENAIVFKSGAPGSWPHLFALPEGAKN